MGRGRPRAPRGSADTGYTVKEEGEPRRDREVFTVV